MLIVSKNEKENKV